ncbi:hypothetical protein ABXK61_13130 [Burkholderia sola]|uniref:hypothetical protein n=1 Tax=Burkholderia TaxID=32008 RepID=UPI001AE8F911|nr:hypothetical protein [Burkholderia sp. AcTa6-5]MBP0714255.1 hypothetical protein [Burkholderia sp. AcTa6-5]
MFQQLFNRVGRKFDNVKLPTRSDEIGDYRSNFEQAVDFTAACGFKMALPYWVDRDILGANGDFIEPAFRAGGVEDPAKAAGQCLKWCHYLAPHFERQLGAKVWVTIGQLWKDDQQIFSPTWTDLKRWCKTGITLAELHQEKRQGINLHAWLTVESGEIIEPTFGSSLAAFAGDAYAKLSGAVVWGRDPHVLNHHRYFPMAVGQAFAEAIGNRSELPLLATDATSLHNFPMMLVATHVDK